MPRDDHYQLMIVELACDLIVLTSIKRMNNMLHWVLLTDCIQATAMVVEQQHFTWRDAHIRKTNKPMQKL